MAATAVLKVIAIVRVYEAALLVEVWLEHLLVGMMELEEVFQFVVLV